MTPTIVYATDVNAASRALAKLANEGVIESPNGFLILPANLLKRDDRPT
jgi:hypothetical protein